jgi:hypothetical protein
MATSEAEIRRQDTSEHITVKRPWFKNDARAGLAVHYGTPPGGSWAKRVSHSLVSARSARPSQTMKQEKGSELF